MAISLDVKSFIFGCDSYYEIGSGHNYCEDYAFHRSLGDYSWAIVSDGCSGAEHTDIGSRLLVRKTDAIFRKKISEGVDFNGMIGADFDKEVLVGDKNDGCISICNGLGVNPSVLSATLWIVICKRTGNSFQWKVVGFGDGQMALRLKNGTIRVYSSTFPSGAPFYPIYKYIDQMEDKYLLEFSNKQIFNTFDIYPGIKDVITFSAELSYRDNFTYDTDEFANSVTVMTDGFRSYNENVDDGINTMRWSIERFLDFKSLEGVFVQRRMRALSRRDVKEKIAHFDDLGAATVLMTEESVEPNEQR